jgi:hypothetical protein
MAPDQVLRSMVRHVLLHEALPTDATWEAFDGKQPAFDEREHPFRHLLVVGDDVALCDPIFGEHDPVGVGDLHRADPRPVRELPNSIR